MVLTETRCTVFSGRGFLGLPQKGISSHYFCRSPVPFITRSVAEKRVSPGLRSLTAEALLQDRRTSLCFQGEGPISIKVAKDVLPPGRNRLSSFWIDLGQLVKYSKPTLKMARCIIVEELSLSHLLSSKTSGSQSVISSVQCTDDHRCSGVEMWAGVLLGR